MEGQELLSRSTDGYPGEASAASLEIPSLHDEKDVIEGRGRKSVVGHTKAPPNASVVILRGSESVPPWQRAVGR